MLNMPFICRVQWCMLTYSPSKRIQSSRQHRLVSKYTKASLKHTLLVVSNHQLLGLTVGLTERK